HKDRKREKKDNTPKVDRRRKPAHEVLNEEIFEIIDLNVDEQFYEIRKRQDSANFKNSEYKCTECYKGFLDEDAYKGHMVRHTDQIGSHQCEICKIFFKTTHALRNHATSHMQKFNCKRCSYVTTRRHAAKLHEDYHNGTRYQCPHCQEDFVKFSTYMSHVRIKHPSDFVCELCGYSFISGKGLGLHKKLKHRFDEHTVPTDGPYCEECNVRFGSTEALARHLKMSARHNDITTKDPSRRSKEPRDRCSEKQNEELKRKRRSGPCKPEGPIPCEQCEMQLPDSLSYYRHFRRMHPDKNRTNYPSMKSKCMCEVCGKMFQSLALLQDHSWTHTESKQFQCAQCHKRFQRKYRLIAHHRLHSTPRPHACTACGKRLSSASNVRRHMLSHTGLKPFKCEMCGKGFKHASEKRVHITYVHLKKPWPKRSRGKRRTDGRTSQPSPTAPSIEVDMQQPLWSSCDPKIPDGDKQMYYNMKIL
ncbi:uncharacterized protein ACR2FA_010869, partial [Aphomia sociella]